MLEPHSKRTRVRLLISGRVQGVGYRAATWNAASSVKIDGWVRNLPDGRVEAVFEGAEDVVKQMTQWCYVGPPGAIVEAIAIDYEPPEGLHGFQIVY